VANDYTFHIEDRNNLVSAALEDSIARCAQYAIGLISRYIDWQGTLDFVVEVRPGSELTWSDADGLLPSYTQVSWTGSAWSNDTLTECLTGIDPNPGRADAGCTIYLADDGTIRDYGAPVWFDPDPRFERNPAVPAGMHDFVGLFTHEVFHSLGMIAYTKQWTDRIVTAGDLSYFTGAQAAALYGGPIPFLAGFDHYGDTAIPSIPISRGLMFEWGNYEGNRFDLDRIDLAILADLGYHIKSYDGLSLFEMVDTNTALAGSGGADALYGDYHDNVLTGLGGNDRIEGGAGSDQLTGGEGDDLLDGGAGGDDLRGGAGNDTYVVDQAGDVVTELVGEGVDTIRTGLGAAGAIYTLGAWLENLVGTSNSGQSVAANALANVVTMGNGDDVVDLSAGGNDIVAGNGGNDYLYFGAAFDAADRADGGAGSDVLGLLGTYNLTLGAGSLSGIEALSLLSGTSAGGSSHVSYSITTVDANVPAGGRLTVYAGGLLPDETLLFDGHAETDGALSVYGGAGIDLIAGGPASDAFIGGGGDDQLYGLGGNDWLEGGLGADLLRGGFGSDLFVYKSASESTAAARDHIVDFEDTVDLINLQEIDANANVAGDQAFSFIGENAFSHTAGELRIEGSGSNWFVQGDIDGDGLADLVIQVDNFRGYALQASNFML
jgi:Ca2+-binding RTX toxin-like protein